MNWRGKCISWRQLIQPDTTYALSLLLQKKNAEALKVVESLESPGTGDSIHRLFLRPGTSSQRQSGEGAEIPGNRFQSSDAPGTT